MADGAKTAAAAISSKTSTRCSIVIVRSSLLAPTKTGDGVNAPLISLPVGRAPIGGGRRFSSSSTFASAPTLVCRLRSRFTDPNPHPSSPPARRRRPSACCTFFVCDDSDGGARARVHTRRHRLSRLARGSERARSSLTGCCRLEPHR